VTIFIKSLQEALEEIKNCAIFVDEKISPLGRPEIFGRVKNSVGTEIYLPSVDYRARLYSWMIKRVKNTEEKPCEVKVDPCINEMFANAFLHGNLSDKNKEIEVKLAVGYDGSILSVSDEGEGFNYRRVLENFRNGEKYFTYQGSGFVSFEKSKHTISFDDGGRTVFLQYLIEQTS